MITGGWLLQESGEKPGEAGANHPGGQFTDQCDISCKIYEYGSSLLAEVDSNQPLCVFS